MKVTAIKPAFFNGARVHAGDVIDVPEGLKASWFVPADSVKAAKPAAKTAAKAAPQALSQAGKDEAKTFVQAHSEKADLA